MAKKKTPTQVRNQRKKIKSKRPPGGIGSAQLDKRSLVEGALPAKEENAIERTSIRRGWAVPEDKKEKIVDRLVGEIENEENGAKEVAMCANVLTRADQMQWERDHPKEAGQAKGGIQQTVMVDWEAMKSRPPQVDPVAERLSAEEVKTNEAGQDGNGPGREGSGTAAEGGQVP